MRRRYPEIEVEVGPDGQVTARRHDGARVTGGTVALHGLDETLVRLFQRWLLLRDRSWQEPEIRAFGALLHRCLFPDSVWAWIERGLAEFAGSGPVRLSLAFPATGPYARMAAIPWEYLCCPDRPGRPGFYLARDARCVLSRYIPLEAGRPSLAPEPAIEILAVVSQPDDPRLGEVDAEPVLAALRERAKALHWSVTELTDPTAAQLQDALAERRRHLVHYMGHGEYDERRDCGALALVDPDGGADWVVDRRLAEIINHSAGAPRVVVLHACEGARADFAESFAGLAPQLIRSGTQCVVAMQYAVTNRTATEFSLALYDELARGCDVDVAVQNARFRISGLVSRDPRLLGIPVVYLHSRQPLLATAGGPQPA